MQSGSTQDKIASGSKKTRHEARDSKEAGRVKLYCAHIEDMLQLGFHSALACQMPETKGVNRGMHGQGHFTRSCFVAKAQYIKFL